MTSTMAMSKKGVRRLTTELFPLDVDLLARRGKLRPGARATLAWRPLGPVARRIWTEASGDALHLSAPVPSGKSGCHCPVFQHVSLARVPCYLGWGAHLPGLPLLRPAGVHPLRRRASGSAAGAART